VTSPVIGITTGYKAEKRPTISVPAAYVDSILLAGGIPLLLPPVDDAPTAERLVEHFNAVLLTGGPDLDPAEYGQEPHPETKPLHPRRNRFDLSIARLAADRSLPVMGICLGCQVLNVALGGTLYQHLPEQLPAALTHSAGEPGGRAAHRVQIADGSRLARIVGTTDLETNSSHHQAIREVAPALRAVAWSADGVIEAAEARDERFLLAIQWHPENLAAERPEHLALFTALVEAAGGQWNRFSLQGPARRGSLVPGVGESRKEAEG